MKGSAIKGLPVRPSHRPREWEATVDDLILDMDERRVEALQLTPAGEHLEYAVPSDSVVQVEPTVVVLEDDAEIMPLDDLPTYLPKPTLNKIIGQKALTEDGRVIGKVVDVEVDTASWTITGFGLVSDLAGAFLEGERVIPSDEVLSAGALSILVSDRVAGGVPPETEPNPR